MNEKQEKRKKKKRDKKQEKMGKLQSESIGFANFSMVNRMEEKLAKSKQFDSMPQVHKIRRKVMKEIHYIKRHSKGEMGAKKLKKINNLLGLL